MTNPERRAWDSVAPRRPRTTEAPSPRNPSRVSGATISAPSVSEGSQIVGLGHYQPGRVMTNADVGRLVDTNDEWIRSRTGILTRHIADGIESVPYMAARAGELALGDAGISSDAVDMVIVATTTAEDRTPNTAGRVAEALQMVAPAIIDINTACSGFVHALALADQSIRCGSARTALVIGSEKLSSVTDWADRDTCILTADGAGAAVLGRSSSPRLGPVVWGSVPGMTSSVRIESPAGRFQQDGRRVFRWAISEATAHAERAVSASGMDLADIEVLLLHQANLRIIDPLAKALGLANKIVLTDVTTSGNTSAASIPLGFSKWWHAGLIPADVPALMFGFGGGFSYAGQVVMTPTSSTHPQPQRVA
jgi:3-oxoacyl-[acyl-carrier-protein] synthase-3